jgi:ubiquinone/menaquinone biosynthesis C-methylase UbiE
MVVPSESRWLHVGCGTGALSQTILQTAAPRAVTGLDRSTTYVTLAREQVRDARVAFAVSEAQVLVVEATRYEAVVAGLLLNVVPQPSQAVAAMAWAVRPGGMVAAYVWDYAGTMEPRVVWAR